MSPPACHCRWHEPRTRFHASARLRRSTRRHYLDGRPVLHVVVIGCGRVGSELASALEYGGHTVAVVDKNARAFRRLGPEFAGTTVVGFGFDRDHLTQAGIEEAGAFAS